MLFTGIYSEYANSFTNEFSMKDQSRWVVWNLETVGTGKSARSTKIPYSITGKKASSTDPSTWTTYAKAKKASEFFSGVGIVFTPEQTLLGIDIDHVLDDKGKVFGPHKEAILQLVSEAKTHTEVSPSGTGLHLYLAITDGPLSLEANRHAPFEAYTSGRFFTFTEKHFGKKRPIRSITRTEALRLLTVIGYPWPKVEVPTSKTAAELLTGSIFEDKEVLRRMFDSKNGPEIKKLYDGDTSGYTGDGSRADAALLSHLAFWTRKDATQIERIWLASPLGARKKTQDRVDYRTRSINGAIKSCTEVYRTQEERVFDEFGIDFLYTLNSQKDKVITQSTENICRVLREHPDFKDRFRFDNFTQTFETFEKGEWRNLRDTDAISVQTAISIVFPFFRKLGKDMAYDAIMKVAEENMIDSAIDFVTSLKWDETPRLDQWLQKTFGVEDTEYHRAVGSNWIKGLIKRIVRPGCKFDYVLVLEGEQGVKKSTSLQVLGELPNGRNMHVETTMSTDTKDFFMQMQGKAIIEFSEGETLNRTEVKKMKAIITTASDKYRPPYSRVSLDFPRRCVFAMTTNQDEYLKDETGNRRWLPVKVVLDQADVAWLADNRDQLFAEAYHRVVVLNETIYEFPEEETRKQQAQRQVSDPNADRIIDWYYNDQFLTENTKLNGITPEMVWRGALSGFGPLKKFDEMAITNVLKNVLNLTKRRKMVDGYQGVRWFAPESEPESESEVTSDSFIDELNGIEV